MPIHTAPRAWILETRNTAYALGLNASGALVHRYWGPRLPFVADYPPARDPGEWCSFYGRRELALEEYPAYGGATYREPCFKATFADGVRDTVLEFKSSRVEPDERGSELQIVLEDAHYPLRVTLHYHALEAFDLLERWVTVQNFGAEPIRLERIFSAQWHLPPLEDYRLSHLGGRWLEEFGLIQEPLTHGVKLLESRRITSGHQNYPWFALDRADAPALEEGGELWFGALEWSGNWKATFERTEFGSTRASIGLNDWDFALLLNGGESFVAPKSVSGYSSTGFGGASRALHRQVRSHLPHGDAPHKVLYNSWEATGFEVSEAGQIELADIAASLGVELFVMDDGWFQGRDSDAAGLGDWWPDGRKFPQGLEPLIARVNAHGMDFGLWLEPEMVSPDSDLYRAHPDWAIHFPTRARTEMRNQLILNLAKLEVQDHLIAVLDGLLSNHNISFIKWDMNRNASEPGWDGVEEPRALWVRYVEGVYRVWDTLRQRHPNVTFQSCSGGGGRADIAMLTRADQVWTSDNTEPTARLGIQHGASMVLPASTLESWVTDMESDQMPPFGGGSTPLNRGKMPLEFRFHVSMCGTLGIGANLLHWDESERQQARALIEQYKAVRPIVQNGELFRLKSPTKGAFSALEYLSGDQGEGVLFAFRTHLSEPVVLPPLRLAGLEREALYQMDGLQGPLSGAALMNAGISLELKDFSSVLQRFYRV